MYCSAIEVLKGEYPRRTKMKYDSCMIVQGRLEVLVIEHDSCYDVWNMHSLQTYPSTKIMAESLHIEALQS